MSLLSTEVKIDKIRKLLAKTKNNPLEDEVNTAFLLAQKLMVKWGIEMSEVSLNEDLKEVLEIEVEGEAARIPWKTSLAYIIASNFRCTTYYKIYKKVVNYRTSSKRQIVFIGLKNDVEIATEVYKSAVSYILWGMDKCYQKFYLSGKYSRGIRGDYVTGFLRGLKEKFQEQVKEEGWGLVLVRDAVVDEFFKNIEKDFVKTRRCTAKVLTQNNLEAQRMGYKDGKNFDGFTKKINIK